MSKRLIAASAISLLLSTPASAAKVPALSGSYIVTYNEICQAGSNDDGRSHSEIVLATFDPAAGTATLSGKDVNGGLRVNGADFGYETDPVTGTGSYTNTKNTLTLNGITFNVLYGAVKKDVVQSAVFNGITDDNESRGIGGLCAASAMAIHQ
jgi:hypothetical protein